MNHHTQKDSLVNHRFCFTTTFRKIVRTSFPEARDNLTLPNTTPVFFLCLLSLGILAFPRSALAKEAVQTSNLKKWCAHLLPIETVKSNMVGGQSLGIGNEFFLNNSFSISHHFTVYRSEQIHTSPVQSRARAERDRFQLSGDSSETVFDNLETVSDIETWLGASRYFNPIVDNKGSWFIGPHIGLSHAEILAAPPGTPLPQISQNRLKFKITRFLAIFSAGYRWNFKHGSNLSLGGHTKYHGPLIDGHFIDHSMLPTTSTTKIFHKDYRYSFSPYFSLGYFL